MPIFVYRCDCGHRFERLVPRDADAPACPECGSVHAQDARRAEPRSRRRRGPTPHRRVRGSAAGGVPIPWRGVVSGGPEKVKREVEFRQRLERPRPSAV